MREKLPLESRKMHTAGKLKKNECLVGLVDKIEWSREPRLDRNNYNYTDEHLSALSLILA